MLLRCFAAVIGGLALAAAFEPVGMSWLMTPAIAALVLSLRGLPLRWAWLVSLSYGVAFIFTVMVWMRAVGTDAWLAMCSVEAAFFVPLGLGVAMALRHRWWPWWAALWWVAIETWRGGWPFSGMPFGRLSYATADTVWAEALPWLGMTGVSLLVALSGTGLAWLLVEARHHRPSTTLAWSVPLIVATVAPSVWPYSVATKGEITVAAVQGDVPGAGTDVAAVHREVTANHVAATEALGRSVRAGETPAPDLVVWPENSTAVDPFRDGAVNAAVERAVEAVGVPVLIGAMVDAPRETQVLNQGIVWRPGAGGGDRYTKRHPVPYGEYIPFRGSLIPSDYGQLRMIPRDMVRGTRLEPLRAAGVRIADAICFDVAYDDGIADQLQRGGQLITVQTSNAMFINTGQIDQQFEISRLRAIEGRRWVVVAAINGVSGIISPAGEVVVSAAPRTQEVLVESIGLSSQVTPASRMGVWTGRAILVLVCFHALFCVVRCRRPRRRETLAPQTPALAG